MLVVGWVLVLIFNIANANSIVASPGFCFAVFDRGMTDLELNFIDQLRDESETVLADYLRQVKIFSHFSIDEARVLAKRIQSEDLASMPTDQLLAEITADLRLTRQSLREEIEEEAQVGDTKPTNEKSYHENRRERPKLELVTSTAEPIKENFVQIGNIGDARIAYGIYRYMVLKPWEVSQMSKLAEALAEKNITIQQIHPSRGILVIVGPAELARLGKMQEVLMEAMPYNKEPEDF